MGLWNGSAEARDAEKSDRFLCSIVANDRIARDARFQSLSLLEKIRIVKGLMNRVSWQDQWDWFIVSGQFGQPPPEGVSFSTTLL